MQQFDVAIVGLGPAGATLARLLSPALAVLAVDRKAPQGESAFEKPCGGLLSPDAQRCMAQLGLTIPLDILVSPQIFAVRTLDLNTTLQRHYQRCYLNLDRLRFDQWLMSLIPPKVEVLAPARCLAVKKESAGYTLQVECRGQLRQYRSRLVVGADGARSLVRRTFYPQAKLASYVAIQQHFDAASAEPCYLCIFDKELSDCYMWGLTKDNTFILGGAFSPSMGKSGLALLKERLKPYGFDLGEPKRTEACAVLRPSSPFCCVTGRQGALLVGEAAGFISPSSLEGLSFALKSALALSEAINLGGDIAFNYARSALALRLKLLGKILKQPFIFNPYLRYAVMACGVRSITLRRG